MDFVIEVNKMPLPGETIIGKNFTLVPGGKGANQAYAIGKLGAEVSILGAVGNDEYGKKLLQNLNSVNVNVDNVITISEDNTGCAFINVDDNGENNIVVISGANNMITKETIDNNIELIKEADIIVVQLEIPLDVVSYAVKLAKNNNRLVILDPAPAVSNLSGDLLSNIDIIKPNETEIQILSGIEINTNEDIVKAAKILIDKGVKNVIVSLGGKGSILVTKDNVLSFNAPNVEVVDTTAAGDSFIAAIAKSLLDGKTLIEAIEYAHIVSAMVVTKKGAQTSIPNQTEINEFISNWRG